MKCCSTSIKDGLHYQHQDGLHQHQDGLYQHQDGLHFIPSMYDMINVRNKTHDNKPSTHAVLWSHATTCLSWVEFINKLTANLSDNRRTLVLPTNSQKMLMGEVSFLAILKSSVEFREGAWPTTCLPQDPLRLISKRSQFSQLLPQRQYAQDCKATNFRFDLATPLY